MLLAVEYNCSTLVKKHGMEKLEDCVRKKKKRHISTRPPPAKLVKLEALRFLRCAASRL